MKKQELELEKKYISLNGDQMDIVRGGGDPDDNGDGVGKGGSGPGPGNGNCDTNLQGGQNCTTVYQGRGGTDNLCDSYSYYHNRTTI